MTRQRPRPIARAGLFRAGISAFAGLLLLAAAPPAGAMSVAEFLGRARALQAMGPLATLSTDWLALGNELRTIRAAHRADLAAARARGEKPRICPPEKPVTLTAAQLFAELERIPPARRGMSMKAAYYAFMQRRYPCR